MNKEEEKRWLVERLCRIIEDEICKHYDINLGELYCPLYYFENNVDKEGELCGYEILEGKVKIWLGIELEGGITEGKFYVAAKSLEIDSKVISRHLMGYYAFNEEAGHQNFYIVELNNYKVNEMVMDQVYACLDREFKWIKE